MWCSLGFGSSQRYTSSSKSRTAGQIALSFSTLTAGRVSILLLIFLSFSPPLSTPDAKAHAEKVADLERQRRFLADRESSLRKELQELRDEFDGYRSRQLSRSGIGREFRFD